MCLLLTLCAAAQTQQGYVKTKGRLINGKVVAGQRIAGATVQVKGHNALVSKSDGAFSFPIPSSKFTIQSVKKQGFVLADPEVLSKQYSYSSNPLILVLEIPLQRMEDKLATERKLRKTLSRQLQQHEDEIERLREQNKLTEEQYHKALQDLYAEQGRSLNLVSQMAERYSKIDFDQLDEFNRNVSECIIEGRLSEADSLIKSKGDIIVRIDTYNKHHEANVQARKQLEDSEAMELKDREDLAQDCYNQFLIYKLQHRPDSAAYYIEQRVMLDTTNVDWLYEAACYLKECSKKDDARNLFLTADRQIELSGLDDLLKHALILKCIADLRITDEEAIDYYKRAISKFIQIDRNHPELIGCYWRLANCYMSLTKVGETDSLSRECMKESKEIAYRIFDSIDTKAGTNVYLGVLPIVDKDKVVQYYEKALKKESFQNSECNETLARIHMKLGEFDKSNSILHYKTAYEIQNKIDSLNPIMGDICEKIAHYSKTDLKDPLTAIQYYLQAISVWQKNYGDYCSQLGDAYECLGHTYDDAKDYSMAINCYLKAIDVKKRIYGEKGGARNYGAISRAYHNMGEIEKAIGYLQIQHQFDGELSITVYGEKGVCIFEGPLSHKYYEELGDLYSLLKNHQKSTESYESMLDEIEKEKHSLSSYSRSFGLHNAEAKGYGCVGASYQSLGHSTKALEFYKKSIQAFASSMGEDSLEMMNDFKVYSDEFFTQDDLNDALPVYIRLLNLIANADDKKSYSEYAKEILTRIDDFRNHSKN